MKFSGIEKFSQGVGILGLQENSYVFAGSAPLEILGIRTATDVDVIVSYDVWCRLADTFREEMTLHDRRFTLKKDGILFDVTHNWLNLGSKVSQRMLETSLRVDGIHICPLKSMIQYKMFLGRPKDGLDIDLAKRCINQIS